MPITTGLELSTDSLKFVAAEARGARRHVHAWGRIPLGEGTDFGQALDQLRAEVRIPLERLRLAIGTQPTQLRMLSLPRVPRGELSVLVQAEIEKELELASEEMWTGWHLLTTDKKAERLEVLLAITPRSGLDAVRQALETRGLVPELVTTSSLALFGQVRLRADLRARGSCFGILHIGLERMVLALVDGGSFRLLRDLGVGMDASLLGGSAVADDELDPLESWSRGLDATNMVARQARRTFEYDQRQHPDRPVTHLFLAGDAARAAALAPLLANELGLPVDLLDPLAGANWVELDATLAKEAAAFALPLALAAHESGQSILNLVPRRREIAAAQWTGAWITASVLVTAASVAAIPVDQRLEQMRGQRAALEENRAVLPAIQSNGSLVDTRAWEAAARRTPVPIEPLLWLGEHLPVEGTIEEIDVAREGSGWKVSWVGNVKSSDPDQRLKAWAAFQAALEATPSVSRIEFDPAPGDGDLTDRELPIDGSFHLEATR